ncbi:PIR Superfamily Protein [Plasmodium ovale curtisi]|uniref:PIR Superfamily Protein n=1 Tax=Plasmodium ovale curtisi TaxID=864141 RepID=A0A1A8WR50_PLAOA|nr:PIR Superfamily Protein [Plasmodium ovale curtisi]
MTYTKDVNYELCEHFTDYIRLEESILSNVGESGNFNEKCEHIEEFYSGKLHNSKDICTKFKCIATKLLTSTKSEDSGFINACFYLNFWLNYKLMDTPKSIVSAKQFYDKLKDEDSGFDSEHKLINKIHVIEEEHLKNMVMLHNLHKKYNEIHDIIHNTSDSDKNCMNYSEQCIQKFDEANKNCSPYNIKFCKALEAFKEKYEYMLNDSEYENCKLHKPLSSVVYVDPLDREKAIEEDFDFTADSSMVSGDQAFSTHLRNIMVVIFTVISFFLVFLGLYKATPFGIYFRRQIRRVKENWINLEYVNENKSILQPTEYQPINEENNQLHISYY